MRIVYAELDRDPGAAGIPAGIWRFCPGPGPGRDFVFCRDFSRDFYKVKSIFERDSQGRVGIPLALFEQNVFSTGYGTLGH